MGSGSVTVPHAGAVHTAENPEAQVRCPEKGDGLLIVHDEAFSKDPARFERYLVCDACGARNVMLMRASPETD
ncbi:hypothetical protein KH5H1_68810 [Corallococcus caeni]|nr:hypothetical protein KH5H1_68810 [Corallococcus sp. KH5-1]